MNWSTGFLMVLWTMLQTEATSQVVISEFMADNTRTVADNFGQFSDWIEIHNPTSVPVDLNQWALTDDAARLTKWRFPAVTLEPGGFLVVWASNRNLRSAAAPLHTNFALSKGGEYLALVRPDGTVEQDFGTTFPAQNSDESFGLQFDRTVHLAEGVTGWLWKDAVARRLDINGYGMSW
jgi:hypothetical protein